MDQHPLRNQEYYLDPTAAAALDAVTERFAFRPIVYVCSPFAGNVNENTACARIYSRYVVEKGGIPIAPHLLLPQFMDDAKERDLALFMALVILSRCAEVWVFGNVISEGMAREIAYAERKGKPVRYINEVG